VASISSVSASDKSRSLGIKASHGRTHVDIPKRFPALLLDLAAWLASFMTKRCLLKSIRFLALAQSAPAAAKP